MGRRAQRPPVTLDKWGGTAENSSSLISQEPLRDHLGPLGGFSLHIVPDFSGQWRERGKTGYQDNPSDCLWVVPRGSSLGILDRITRGTHIVPSGD